MASATQLPQASPAAEIQLSGHCVLRYWASVQDILHREEAVAELNGLCGQRFTAGRWFEILDAALDRLIAPGSPSPLPGDCTDTTHPGTYR